GGVVGTMIGSLGDGGISKVLVSDAVGMITKGAVEELKNAGLSESASLATAVQSITKGAVTAISTSKVEGVAAADYSSLATQISKSAASAVGSIVTSDADIKTLAGAVATGAANGIVAVQVASGTGLSATEYRAMIQGITSGTTEGVMTIASVQAAGSGASLIGKITESASYALISNAASVASKADIFAEVTKGAAAAAQTSIAGGLSETALAQAIVLKDSSNSTVAAVLKDIQDGIVIGTNQPPLANAGADQSVKVGELVTLDGKASSDADAGDTLTYTWSISRKPTGSAAALTATGTVATSFTADLAGTYILSLKVSDGKAEADAYCTVVAVTRSTTAYMEARDKTIEDYIKFCDQYLGLAAPDYAAADDCFNKALASAALVVADTTTEAKYVARAMTDIGWAYIHHGGRLVGHDSKIVSDAYWRSEADRWLRLVKDSATYYGADSGFATQCDAGLAWLAAATGTTGTVTAD
ncbi:MAG: PKD domain-containing protein, partial [Spirochaetota bacterium]